MHILTSRGWQKVHFNSLCLVCLINISLKKALNPGNLSEIKLTFARLASEQKVSVKKRRADEFNQIVKQSTQGPRYSL